VIAQFRQMNMRDVIRLELGHIPWSIATTGVNKKNEMIKYKSNAPQL
jgi:hypothetical protein